MDYKKIIRSRRMRLKILSCLKWVPDKSMLKIQYRIKFGRTLNLKNPKRFTEKIQWYKLYYREPNMIRCVDKYDAREFVKSIGLAQILPKNYGVYLSFKEIDFGKLPNEFVIKDTLGGGGNSIYICHNKHNLDFNELRQITNNWLGLSLYKNGGREWPYYSGKQNRLLVEEYLKCTDPHGLVDYKFLCFNGKVSMIYVMCDRVFGQDVKLGIYNRSLRKISVCELTEKELDFEYEFPDNMTEMIHIAERLSESFPQVRVDLYNNDGRIIFGELTFFDESGYMIFNPDSFDYQLGNQFLLPKPKKIIKENLRCGNE